MSPSQNNRHKPASRSRRLPAAFVALALGASLAVSACGTQSPNAAAIVNGTSISERDVQSVTDQVNGVSQGGQKLSAGNALLSLILAPYVRDEAERVHKTVSDSQAKEYVKKQIAHPTAATLAFVRMQLGVQELDQASKNLIVSQLDKAKITVNPRYGTFDLKQITMNPTAPNWIKATSAPAPAK